MNHWRLLAGPAALLLWGACATTGPDRAEQAVPPPVQEEPAPVSLAERLPRDTLFYGRLDPGRATDELLTYLRFVDAEAAQEMRVQAARAYDAVLRMGANRGFAPRLARAWAETRWHLIVMNEDRPPAVATEGQEPRRPHRLLGPDRVVVLVCETTPDLASDFLDQVKAELERHAARHPGSGGPSWSLEAIEDGELLRLDGAGFYLGSKAGYLIAADGRPDRLLAALDAPAAENLAETERYGRLAVGDPTALFVGNARALIREAAQRAREERQEILAALDAAEKPMDKNMHQVRLDALDVVESVKRILGLDRFVAIGMRSQFSASEQAVRYGLIGDVMYQAPLSPVMRQIFEGGRAFRLPAAGLGRGLSIMWRFGASEIFGLVSEGLEEKQRRTLSMGDALVRGYTGYTIGDLLRLFSGDFYFFSDLVELPAPAPPAAAQATAGTGAPTPPAARFDSRNLFALGVQDRQATAQALQKLYGVAQADPSLSRILDQMDYQDRVLYLIGPKGQGADQGVEVEHAVAVVLLDKHLVAGGFDAVTALIRRLSDAGSDGADPLGPVVGARPDATFLLVATQGVLHRFQRLLEQSGEEPSVEDLITELRDMDLPLDGDAAEADLRDALIRMLRASEVLSKRLAGFSGPALVIRGRAVEEAYRLQFETELRRR